MYIKKVTKTNGRDKKKYSYLHLVESIRTEAGPRQRLILNLGKLDIESSQYSILSKRIEEILTGQKRLYEIDLVLEKQAQIFSKKIFEKKSHALNSNSTIENFQKIEVDSLGVSGARSIGAEYICTSIWSELGLDDFFIENGIAKNQLSIFKALIIGRLIEPGSELHTKNWVENRSALYELCGSPLKHSKNSYYYAGDALFSIKGKLEKYLFDIESKLFPVKEHLYFYDLTNTYFEGSCLNNPKAKFGRSKEKRSDCKLVTLGMIVDQFGFSKYTKLFDGNQSESSTLKYMVEYLSEQLSDKQDKTIIMDAGIATEDNLKFLRENNHNYVVVNRSKSTPFEKDFSQMEIVREDVDDGIQVEVKKFKTDDDTYVLCRSKGKQRKEESMRNRVEQIFLEKLEYLKNGLTIKKRMKKYLKVAESIGRLKEKYSKITKLYTIDIIPENGTKKAPKNINVIDIKYEKKEEKYNSQTNGEGSYVLRTNRDDLTAREIWEIYILQGNIENAFRNMKSHLGLRPNFHIKEKRVDAHMFISIIAYHILNIIEKKLQQNGDKRKWVTIRDIMSTNQRMTIEFTSFGIDRASIHNQLRVCTKPEANHIEIYNNLGLSHIPLKKLTMSKIRSDHKSP